jgi:hypothetical protein
MDSYELLPGQVPVSFLSKIKEKHYKKGEGFEIPKCFAQHEPILQYIAQHGWVLEGIVGKKKGAMVVKDVEEEELEMPTKVVEVVNVVKKEVVACKNVPKGVLEARAHADKVLEEMRASRGIDWYDLRLKAIEYQDRQLLIEERDALQRRRRFDTYDEMRLEELNALLG